jgi:hypothetical protein
MALLGEVERGFLTGGAAAAALGLDAGETADAQALIARIVPPLESYAIGGGVTLTNIGTAFRPLGMLRLQAAGITGFEFSVLVNKVGSGTQSWRLFDRTNNQQITVFDDTGAAGERLLGPVTAAVGPLAAGMRTLQVDGRSSVAADDPIFGGASLVIRRVGIMTAEVLHEILLLAQNRVPGYDTEAELRTRLGT